MGGHSLWVLKSPPRRWRLERWASAESGERAFGGEGGIRTPDTVARMPHFECGAFNHSATSPNPDFRGFVRFAGGARSALCYAFATLSAIGFLRKPDCCTSKRLDVCF